MSVSSCDKNALKNCKVTTVLAIGDPHFKVSNVKETDEMSRALVELAEEIKPDFIVNLGDTLHRHETIHISPLMRAEKMMQDLSKISKCFLIVGNHDRPNNSNYMTDEHPFNALKKWDNIVVVDKVCRFSHNSLNFVFVPYVPPGTFKMALDQYGISLDEITCIFAHQEFYGAKMGAIESKCGDVWCLKSPLVVSGHIHDYDQLQPNIIYTGTPMQHAFGDRSDKTVSIFRFYPNGKWTEERKDLGLIKREIVYLKYNQIEAFVPNPRKLTKIVIKGDNSEIKTILKSNKIRELKKKGIHISYKIVNGQITQQPKHYNDRKISYLNRLYNAISHDPGQSKWYHSLFGQSKK